MSTNSENRSKSGNVAQGPKKKKQKTTTKKFVMKAEIPHESISVESTHKSAKEAAKKAWELVDEHGLDVISMDWTTEHGRYGEQPCYDVMVTRDDEQWEEDEVFIKYMTRNASRRPVELNGGGCKISIHKVTDS